jgi:hypothetical protein
VDEMKKVFLMLSAAVLVLGLAFSAQAVTINNAPSGEVNLWDIINSWTIAGFVDKAALNSASIQTTIPAGSYVLVDYAGYAGFSQEFGDFDATGAAPAKNTDYLVKVAGGFKSNQSAAIPFSQANSIAFFDYADGYGAAITTKVPSPSTFGAGIIFDFTAAGYGYVIAFEDGNNSSLGDKDYNDFVARVVTPIPGSLLLLGSGLVGLLGLRRRIVA